MPLVEKLFGTYGFDVQLTILVDEDAEAAAARRHGVLPTELPTLSIWISRADLEEEYVRALGAARVWAALDASTLFTENTLNSVVPTGSNGTYTDNDVAQFCRSKKVEAAIVVAGLLDEFTARAINSVESVLTAVEVL